MIVEDEVERTILFIAVSIFKGLLHKSGYPPKVQAWIKERCDRLLERLKDDG